jgi:outer membrane lipoprotein-sorting protein
MRRIIAFLAAGTLAAVVFAQVRGTDMLANFAKALGSAQSLSTTYTVGPVSESKTAYSLDLAKPNLARIDTENQLVVADGKNIITYDKQAKTYFKQPQTDQGLNDLFNTPNLRIWASFFNPKAHSGVVSAKNLGTKNRKGMTLNVVEAALDAQGKNKVTLYLNPTDNVARQAEMAMPDALVILDTKTLTLDKADTSLFAFNAPSGSREMTVEEMNSDKWYTTLDEGLDVAKKTKRLLYVDFYADW